jgi:ABC-type transport system substrate-binding protein
VYIISDMETRVEKFRNGELDELVPDKTVIDDFIDDERLHSYGSTVVGSIDINCQNPDNPICASLNYRKAVYHSINREEAASTIFGHMEPVGTYVNDLAGDASESGLTYRESDYGKAVTEQVEKDGPYGYDPTLALDYLEKAIEECGVSSDDLPITVKFAVNEEDEEWSAFAEYLATQWDDIFEGKMKIQIVPYSGITATDFKSGRDERWDLATNELGREESRKYPYTCYYYFLAKYNSSPNNYHPAEFDTQYSACETIKDGDYETVLAATQKLEQIDLKYVVECPVYQTRNYMLFSDRLQLPVTEYVDDFGWGEAYGDIELSDGEQ